MNGKTLFITGYASSGKTTTANVISDWIKKFTTQSLVILDNDDIRSGINNDLSFTADGRHENIRRVSELACLLCKQGYHVICCFTMPTKELRSLAKAIFHKHEIDMNIVKLEVEWNTCAHRKWKEFFKEDESGNVIDTLHTVEMFDNEGVDIFIDASVLDTLYTNARDLIAYFTS